MLIWSLNLEQGSNQIKVIPSVCCHDCGGACPLNIYVERGRITKIEARDVAFAALRPCLRGLLYHYRVYADDRLKYPMKRTGERGKGEFARVPWDEALTEIAEKITYTRSTYGSAAILNLSSSGFRGRLRYAATLTRFLNLTGGQTRMWGGASNQGAFFTLRCLFRSMYGVRMQSSNRVLEKPP